jgi:transposase
MDNAGMKQYSGDLRGRLVGASGAGLPLAEAARLCRVCPGAIRRWQQRQRTSATVAARPRPGRTPRIGPAQTAALRTRIAAAPDATLAQHCARWASEHGAAVSVATMSRTIRRLGTTLKKSPARQ